MMTRLGRNSVLIKIVSLFILPTFLISNIAFAAPEKEALPAKAAVNIIAEPGKIVIPRENGLIKSQFTGNSGKLIVHIQDAHCNFEAQSNIAKIIENLHKNYNVTLISVEGADGFIDTAWFKAFPDDEVRKEVATYFMKKGEITGPEFLSITTDYPIKLFGAETRSYYIQNLNAFTSSYPLKEETEKYYTVIKAALNKLKGPIYNAELKELDTKMAEYETKKIQFNDYVRFLQTLAERHKINLRQYDNLFKLVNVLIYEKKIDFTLTDKERSALIDDLSKRIGKEALTELVTQSLAFKVGKISAAEYYAYLKAVALKNGVDLSKTYPNLHNYIIYNGVYSRIENEKLFKDIRDLETLVKEKLFQNDDQRSLEKLSRHVDTLLGLINIKLLNGDYDYYKAHKDEFAYQVFADFIAKKGSQYGLSFAIEPPTEAVLNSVPKLEDFYAIAIKRDNALVDNTIGAMAQEKQNVAVLITGGFHSEGMTRLLEKQGISYIVVCPSITKDAPTPYIQILTNQRTSFEDILVGGTAASAKEAKQGMLAPYLYTAGRQLSDNELAEMSDLAAGDEALPTLQARIERDNRDWEGTMVAEWLHDREQYGEQIALPRDPEILFDAYRLLVRDAVTKGRITGDLAERVIVVAKVAFDKIYAARAARIATQPPETPGTGNLIGKITTDDGCVVTEIRGALSADGSILTLFDAGGREVARLSIIGLLDQRNGQTQIERMRLARTSAINDLNYEERALSEDIIAFLEEKVRQGKVLISKENTDKIHGFSDGDIIVVSRAVINDPVAFFHEAGEGFFAARPQQRRALLETTGLTPHVFLRGLGYGARFAGRAKTEEEEKLRSGLGLQDRLFGRAANDRFTFQLRIENLIVDWYNGAGDRGDMERFAASLATLPEKDRYAVLLDISARNARLADLLIKATPSIADPAYYLSLLAGSVENNTWGTRNLIVLGQVVRILGTLELEPQAMQAVIRQLQGLYENKRSRQAFNYIKDFERLPAAQRPALQENIEAQMELDTFIIQALEQMANRTVVPSGAPMRSAIVDLLVAIARDTSRYPSLYFVREQAIFSLRGLLDQPVARAYIDEIIATPQTDLRAATPLEQNFGTSPSYSDVSDFRYAAGMVALWHERQTFARGLGTTLQTTDQIIDFWTHTPWKSAVMLEIEKVVSTIAAGTDHLPPAQREALMNALPQIGIAAATTLDALKRIAENGTFDSRMRETAVTVITALCDDVARLIPADRPWLGEYRAAIDRVGQGLSERNLSEARRLVAMTTLLLGEVETKIVEGRFTLVFPETFNFSSRIQDAELITIGGGGGISFALGMLSTMNFFEMGGTVCPIGVDDDGGGTKLLKAAAIAGSLKTPLIAIGDMAKAIKILDPVKEFLNNRMRGTFEDYLQPDGSYLTLRAYVEREGFLPKLGRGLAGAGIEGAAAARIIREIEESIDVYDKIFITPQTVSLFKNTVQNMVMIGFLIKKGGLSVDEAGSWFVNPYGMNEALVEYIAVMNAKPIEKVRGYPIPVFTTPNIVVATLTNGLRKISQDYFSHTRIREGLKVVATENLFPSTIINPFGEEAMAKAKLVLFPPTSFYSSLGPVMQGDIPAILAERTATDRGFLSAWILPPATDMEETRGMKVGDLLRGYMEKVRDRTGKGRLPNVIFYLDRTDATLTKNLAELEQGIYSGSLALTRDDVERLKGSFALQGVNLIQLDELEGRGTPLTEEEAKTTVIMVPMPSDKVLRLKTETSRIDGQDYPVVRYDEEVVGDIVEETIKERVPRVLNRSVVERYGAEVVSAALHTPLDADTLKNADGTDADAAKKDAMRKKYRQGGFGEAGYGVPEGASVDGSFALGREGDQGYFARGGRAKFEEGVRNMEEFFARRQDRLGGKPIRFIIKIGIGGQHTSFKAITEILDLKTGQTHEVGFGALKGLVKNYEQELKAKLDQLAEATGEAVGWDQVVVMPSSKSGSTDETMLIFTEVFRILLKNAAMSMVETMRAGDRPLADALFEALPEGEQARAREKGMTPVECFGEKFAEVVLQTMHEANFVNGQEVAGAELFRSFSFDAILANAQRAGLAGIEVWDVQKVFCKVIGNMYFETVDRPAESRLSALVRNSDLGQRLGRDMPGFGAMFDNVGGRWTGDLHMMAFLAYYHLNAEHYWRLRYRGVRQVRAGNHIGCDIGNRIADERITDIALVVPDELFWFGKSVEQNFDESIWQGGFANLIAIKKSVWEAQAGRYAGNPHALVLDMAGLNLPSDRFKSTSLPGVRAADMQQMTDDLGEAFTTFYAITHTLGNRLIARAIMEDKDLITRGLTINDLDINDLDNPVTQVLQRNLYLRQPYVELGKKLLETGFKELQQAEQEAPGAIQGDLERRMELARDGQAESNIPALRSRSNLTTLDELKEAIRAAMAVARSEGRTFAPFLYLEGEKFSSLRDYLMGAGIEWVMQGTGDQHIVYQQVLAQPQKFLPFLISFMPATQEDVLPGRPAIGFAKGYLHMISPNVVRDSFAEASYRALVEGDRAALGGKGVFMRMADTEENRELLKRAFAEALKELAQETGEEKLPEETPMRPDDGVKSYPLSEVTGLAPEWQARIAEEQEELRRTLHSSMYATDLKDGVTVILVDDNLYQGPANQVITEIPDTIDRNTKPGSVILVRGRGNDLVKNGNDAFAQIQAHGLTVRSVVTQLSTETAAANQGLVDRLAEFGPVLHINLQGKSLADHYIQILRLFDLTFKIAYKFDDGEIASTLSKISGQPISVSDVAAMLAKKIIDVLPEMRAVDTSEIPEIYKAVKKALTSL